MQWSGINCRDRANSKGVRLSAVRASTAHKSPQTRKT